MNTAWNEQIILEHIAEGNDEQAVRQVDAFLALVPTRIEERPCLLMQLGRRYIVLALFKEHGMADDEVETLLARHFEQRRISPSMSDEHRDEVAFKWYAKAGRLFSAVIEHTPSSPQLKGSAAMHRSLVYAMCAAYDLAQADLDLARSFLPLSPALSYWRGMIFALQGNQEAARTALKSACVHDPENMQYRRAHARVLCGDDSAHPLQHAVR